MAKHTRSARRGHKVHRRQTRKRGGGWSDGPDMVNPGNLVHHQYSGPGKDCAGVPIRPGTLLDYRPPWNGGLPGLAGGGWRRTRRQQRKRGGATQLGSGGPVVINGSVVGTPVNMSGSPAPASEAFRGYTTGAASELAQMSPAAYGGGRRRRSRGQQKGGRYGFFPNLGPLNPDNGVGVAPAPFMRVPCERGTYDALNPNPNDIQEMSTAVSSAGIKGWTQMGPAVYGGGRRGRSRRQRTQRRRRQQKGGVYVGDVDAMRYYAPTAGYDNLPMRPMVPNNPGILMQVGYPAGHFNPACMKTAGGGRRRRRNSV